MDKRGNAVFLELESGKKIVVEYEDEYSDMKYAGEAESIRAFARCTYELSEYYENGKVSNPSKSNKIRSYIKGNGGVNIVKLLRKMICNPNEKFNNTELEFVTELKAYFTEKKVDLGQVIKIIVLKYEVQEWTNCEDYGGSTVPTDWSGIQSYDKSKDEELAIEFKTDVESIEFYKNAAGSDESWIKETSEYITMREEWLYIPKTEEYIFVTEPKNLCTDFVESFDLIYEEYRKRVDRVKEKCKNTKKVEFTTLENEPEEEKTHIEEELRARLVNFDFSKITPVSETEVLFDEDISHFIIEGNVLKKYTGTASYVKVPNGIVKIGEYAFSSVWDDDKKYGKTFDLHVRAILIPDSVNEMEHIALGNIKIFSESVNAKGLEYQFKNQFDVEANMLGYKQSEYIKYNNLMFRENKDGSLKLFDYMGDGSIIVIPEVVEDKIVTVIDKYAFYNCSNIQTVIIPSSVVEIKANAFKNCSNLANISLPKNKIRIHSGAFINCAFKQLVITENMRFVVDDYGRGHFSECKDLELVIIEEGIEEIPERMFSSCRNLKAIVIPASVKRIRGYICESDIELEDIIIKGEPIIEMGNFNDLEKIKYTLKGGIKYLGNDENKYLICCGLINNKSKTKEYKLSEKCSIVTHDAFFFAENIETLIFPDSVIYVPEVISTKSEIKSIHIGKGITEFAEYPLFDSYEKGKKSKQIVYTVSEENPVFTTKDGKLVRKAK